jgi:hypothetical protein
LQAQLKTAQATAQTKVFNRACKANPKEKLFLKTSNASKKIKNATHSRHSMTHKLNTDNGLQGRTTITTGYNTGLAKVAVQCSADTFVVNKVWFSASTFVVKIATFAKPGNVRGNRMKTTTHILTIGLLLILFACGQDSKQPEPYNESRELVPNPEGYKKDTFELLDKDSSTKDLCNFNKYLNDTKTSKLAKAIFNDKDWSLSDDKVLNFLDSLTAKDKSARPFYFRVVTNSYKKSDGYYSEGLGLSGKEYVENNTLEFLDHFENKECFTDKDLETWADIVLLEFSLADEKMYDKPFVKDYCNKLNTNCNKCTASQKETLDKFSKALKTKWADYIKKMRSENQNNGTP